MRLVTITGPGGIGKTRLALQVASGLVEVFPGGIHFVPLSSLSDPGLLASAIVQAVGIGEAGGKSPLEILKENLHDSRRAPMLLLLDNFEHLVKAAPTVAELLATGPNLKIMVTSRSPLHVYGEHEFPVPPLSLPDPLTVPPIEVLLQYPAVALFVQRAIAAKPDFELNRKQRGRGRRDLHPARWFAFGHRTRSRPRQSSFALFHADSPHQPFAVIDRRCAGHAAAPTDPSSSHRLELRLAGRRRAEAFP